MWRVLCESIVLFGVVFYAVVSSSAFAAALCAAAVCVYTSRIGSRKLNGFVETVDLPKGALQMTHVL